MSERISISVHSDGSGIILHTVAGHNASCPTGRIALTYDELHYLRFLADRFIDQIDRNKNLSDRGLASPAPFPGN